MNTNRVFKLYLTQAKYQTYLLKSALILNCAPRDFVKQRYEVNSTKFKTIYLSGLSLWTSNTCFWSCIAFEVYCTRPGP